MSLTYRVKIDEYVRFVNGEREWDGDIFEDFRFEIDHDRLKKALTDLVLKGYFDGDERLRTRVEVMIICIGIEHFEEAYKEDLEEMFYDEAMREYIGD